MSKSVMTRRARVSLLGGVSLLTLLCSGAVAQEKPPLPAIDIGGQQASDAANTPSQAGERTGAGTSGGAPTNSSAAAPAPDQVEQKSAAQANFGYGGGPLIEATLSPAPNPVSSVTPEGIRILGGPAQASSYKPLDLMPSVIEDSADPYGLSFTRSITVRGVSDFFLSRTIDGLPITGIVGGADLIDLNNLSWIDLYRGSLQANQGLGFSSVAG